MRNLSTLMLFVMVTSLLSVSCSSSDDGGDGGSAGSGTLIAKMVGEVKISEETATTVKGTFSFTAKNVNGDQSTKTITEGSFNLEKQSI